MNSPQKRSRKGFTLLEVLLVIAIIAILAAIVIVAINPTKQLAESRNAQRRSDVTTILNAVYQYAIDNDGDLPGPTTIPTVPPGTAGDICQTSGSCVGIVDLSDITTSETYLVSIPVDPQAAGANDSEYDISQSANGRITISAPSAELSAIISVTR